MISGNTATNAYVIETIREANRMWLYGNEPAFTIIPNFLITGIARRYVQVFVKAMASFSDCQFSVYAFYDANRDIWICARSIRSGQYHHGNDFCIGRRTAVLASCVHNGMCCGYNPGRALMQIVGEHMKQDKANTKEKIC